MRRFNYLFSICFGTLLLATNVSAQTGYYRSIGNGDWNNSATWGYSVDNITFNPIGVEGYPGELGIPTSVLIRN